MPRGIYRHSKKQGFQKGHKLNTENKYNWKGDSAKIKAMHMWVVKHKGKASEHKCVDCEKQAEEWSNKNHSYKRILIDYLPRCRKCHKKFDSIYNHLIKKI